MTGKQNIATNDIDSSSMRETMKNDKKKSLGLSKKSPSHRLFVSFLPSYDGKVVNSVIYAI
jgi:hypothetical protein